MLRVSDSAAGCFSFSCHVLAAFEIEIGEKKKERGKNKMSETNDKVAQIPPTKFETEKELLHVKAAAWAPSIFLLLFLFR